LPFLLTLPQLKKFCRNLSAPIIPVLRATFVPNFTFLGLFSPEISFGEKKSPTQTPRQTLSHPAYFAIREVSALNEEFSKSTTFPYNTSHYILSVLLHCVGKFMFAANLQENDIIFHILACVFSLFISNKYCIKIL